MVSSVTKVIVAGLLLTVVRECSGESEFDPEPCPDGDTEGIIEGGKTCPELIKHFPGACGRGSDNPDSRHITCCASCNAAITYIPGCKYGDKAWGCQVSGCPTGNDNCCKTCSVAPPPPPTTIASPPGATIASPQSQTNDTDVSGIECFVCRPCQEGWIEWGAAKQKCNGACAHQIQHIGNKTEVSRFCWPDTEEKTCEDTTKTNNDHHKLLTCCRGNNCNSAASSVKISIEFTIVAVITAFVRRLF